MNKKLDLEIKPILAALWHKKTGPILIIVQIAITLAVVVNALLVVNERVEKMSMPIGIDADNIFSIETVTLSEGINRADFIEEDLRVLRSLPGVKGAISVANYMQSGSTRFEFFRIEARRVRGNSTFTNVNYMDESGLEALGVELLEGRTFRKDEVQFIDDTFDGMPRSIILTESLSKKFFPDESAVGKIIYVNQSDTIEVVGVISDIATGWLANDNAFLADTKYNMAFFPYRYYGDGSRILIRTQEGQLNSMIPQVEEALFAADQNRLIKRIQTQQEVLSGTFSNDYATLVILVLVMVLMLGITGLGIIGLASYSVKQRTRQIGTRRALGARKKDILRYFLVENLLLSSCGILLGAVFTFILSYVLSTYFGGARLDPLYLPMGVIIVYLLGLLAVYLPASKAAKISPAIATRSV